MGPRLVAYNDTGSLEHLIPKPELQPEQPPTESQPAVDTLAQTNGTEPATNLESNEKEPLRSEG